MDTRAILYRFYNRDEYVGRARSRGLLIGGCGEATVRLRPALNLTEAEAAAALDVMSAAAADVVAKRNL
jgi:4-aminobutyrate aminotransferase-like enzyme